MAAESTVKVVFLGDAKDLKRAMGDLDAATSKTHDTFGKLGKQLAGVFAVGAVVGGIKSVVGAASDLNETASKSRTIFGDQADALEQWASGAAKAFGQSKQGALDAAGTFGNLFVQLGIGSKQAATMSKQMVELASDFASFHNANPADVIEAQTAAFRGEYDALQRFVPTINAAAVEQEALAMTGKRTTAELTAQEKALAVNSLMMKGAGDAAGDFARTSDGLANRQRILSAQFEDMQAQIGQKLLPVAVALAGAFINDVVPALEAVGGFIEDNWPAVQAVAEQVFGWMRDNIPPILEDIRSVVEDVLGWIEAFWRTWGGAITTYITGLWNAIRDQIEGALKVIQGIVNVIMGLIHGDFSRVWEGIKQIFSGALQFLQGVVEQAFAAIRLAIEVAMTAMAGVVDAVWDRIVKVFREAPGYILAALAALPGLLFDFGQKAISFWWNGLIQMWGGVLDWFAGLPGRILGAVGDLAWILYDIGRAIIQGLWDGMKSIWGDVAGWLGDIAGKIKGIKGPIDKDRVMLKDEGKAIMAGLHAGMVEGWDPVEKFLRSRNARIGGSVNVTAGQLGYSGGGSSSGAVVMNLTVNNPTFTGQGNIDSLAFSLQKRAAVAFAGAA